MPEWLWLRPEVSPGCSLSRLSPGAEGPAPELPLMAVAGEFSSSPAVGWRPQLHDVEPVHDVAAVPSE